jgi:hypothetical protein
MKNIKFYILGFVTILTMSFVGAKVWYLLSSKEFGFKIEFPEKPSEKSDVLKVSVGKLKLNTYMLQPSSKNEDENLAYSANYTEYPPSTVNSDNKDEADSYLKKGIAGAVANLKGKVLSEKDISIGQYPGKEVRIDYMNGVAVITMRMYLVHNKVYALQTITETKKDGNASLNKFMNSFALLVE